MIRPTHDYVARKPACGCVEAVCYDDGDKETGKIIAEWIKDGYTVDRLPIREAVKAFEMPCTHERNYAGSVNIYNEQVGRMPSTRNREARDELARVKAWNEGKARPA